MTLSTILLFCRKRVRRITEQQSRDHQSENSDSSSNENETKQEQTVDHKASKGNRRTTSPRSNQELKKQQPSEETKNGMASYEHKDVFTSVDDVPDEFSNLMKVLSGQSVFLFFFFFITQVAFI